MSEKKREPSNTIKKRGLPSLNIMCEIAEMTDKQIRGMFRNNRKAFDLLLSACVAEYQRDPIDQLESGLFEIVGALGAIAGDENIKIYLPGDLYQNGMQATVYVRELITSLREK